MAIEITGHTHLACLLGNPVENSISPQMYNSAFQQMDIDCVYLAFPVGKEHLARMMEMLREMRVLGFNLTVPNKTLACGLCDELSPAAQLVGSVNTVVNKNGHLIGHTTDGAGFMRSVAGAGFDIIGRNMTIFGAGGAALSIIAQAALDGVRLIHVFIREQSRQRQYIEDFLSRVRKQTRCMVFLHELGDEAEMHRCIDESAILVNATTIGMSPSTQDSLINDPAFFHDRLVVTDLIYDPPMTKLLRLARSVGCYTFNGVYMLLYQGAESFRLWTGVEMPVKKIREKYFNL